MCRTSNFRNGSVRLVPEALSSLAQVFCAQALAFSRRFYTQEGCMSTSVAASPRQEGALLGSWCLIQG